MEIEIVDQEENPMLHRTDVRFTVVHEEATPSRLSVRDSLAAQLNKDSDEVVVHRLDTKYGMRKTVGYAKVYETSEFATQVEQEHMLERNKITANGESEAEVEADPAEEAAAADEADSEAEAEPEAEADTEPDADAEPEEA